MTTNTLRGHKLMTAELEKALPGLYATDGQGEDALVVAHYFSLTGWHWYALEYDPNTRTFFGWVKGIADEYGYFNLDEMEGVTLAGGVPAIERDLYWTPVTLGEVK
jgi:hypothetical protein